MSIKSDSHPQMLSGPELSLLAEIGFVASLQNKSTDAALIFRGLQLLCPHSAFVYVGLALSALTQGDPYASIKFCEDGLKMGCDDPDLLKIYQAVGLTEAGKKVAALTVLRAIEMVNIDTASVELAKKMSELNGDRIASPGKGI